MSDLYNTIKKLCEERGISIGKMCALAHVSQGSITDLKMGRRKTVTLPVAQKIADTLDVPVSVLVGCEIEQQTQNIPTDQREDVTDDEIKFALFKGSEGITDEMFEEVKRFAAYVKEREREKK